MTRILLLRCAFIDGVFGPYPSYLGTPSFRLGYAMGEINIFVFVIFKPCPIFRVTSYSNMKALNFSRATMPG